MDLTNAAESLASANKGTIDTEHRAPPISQESSSPKLSLPPGIEIEMGLVPIRELPNNRLALQKGQYTSKYSFIDPRNEVKAQRDELAVEVEKLKAEKAQVEREKQIVEIKKDLLEAEVRYKDEVIRCLRTVLENHHLL